VRASLRTLYLCASLVLLGHARGVELPAIRLDTIFPPGGKAGSEVEVGITGSDLDEANALHFSHPGISGEAKEKRFVVKVAPEVPPGIYDVRVSGLLGVSNPRAFAIGSLPEASNIKPGNKPEAAVEFPVDSVFSGISTAAAADYFKFTAKQGQRLFIECATAEIDSRMRPVLAVLDASGRELEISHRSDLLDFTVPAEGTYLLRLNDLTFAGGPTYSYRLSITTAPHIDFIFPPSGQPGAKGRFTIFGRSLPEGAPANFPGTDGKALEKLDVEIDVPASKEICADGLLKPAATVVDGFSYRLKGPRGISNPVFISFASAPVVVEQEPNNQAAQAQKIAPPCEIAGRFDQPGDVDGFHFDAKKGEVWSIEVVSNRLGLPTNPLVVVKRDTADLHEAYGTETPAAERRFSTASNDPACRLEVKEDGPYRVIVRDLFGGTRRDPRNVYRLSIRKESPDFRLAAVVEPLPEKSDDRSVAPRAALIRGGGTIAIKVVAFRRDGFAGDIELAAEGLPAGVTCVPTRILSGKNEGVLLLTASEKPERWVGPIRIVGKAKIGDAELVRDARGAVVRWAVPDFDTEAVQARLTRDFTLAVSAAETAPVSVEPVEEKAWEVAAGGKLEIPLKITRRGEFKQPLKLKGAGAPGIETLKELDVDAAAATATATLDLASVKLPTGSHTIYFQSQAKGKFRGKDVTTTIYSVPIRVAVNAPETKPQP
jgi:hypothetical protein